MKTMIFLSFLLMLQANQLFAIDLSDYFVEKNGSYSVAIGPYTAFKGGMNVHPTGSDAWNTPVFNGLPDFGLRGYLPLSNESNFGLLVDLGYSSYAFKLNRNSSSYASFNLSGDKTKINNYWTEKCSFITISPNIHYSWFNMGLSFGIPAGYDINYPNIVPKGSEPVVSDISPMMDIHIGSMIPLINSKSGLFNCFAQFGYILTGIYKENALSKIYGVNRHPVYLELGINYLFYL